jgi:monofunctional biosynthetic peptidoglycan transglycosylase
VELDAPPPTLAPPPPTLASVDPAWRRPSRPVPRVALPSRQTVVHYATRTLRIGTGLVLALAGLLLALVVLYRWVNPPASALMLGQRLTGTAIAQRWVPIERMSPNLVHAVILSEDGNFCRHRGVDWGEIVDAIDSTRDGVPRGGSTITMQLAKNLFLWPSKSYVRKAIEIALAYAIDAAWPKRRVLEVYLNIAEWGPGVFGAEAASRYHFRKPASLLSAREAALLAVSLPNPFDRVAGSPGPGTQRLASNLMLRLGRASPRATCIGLRAARE